MEVENTEKMNSKKVSIIGAGAVGSSIAYAITLKNIASEIVIIDINQDLCNAEMLDIRHGLKEMGATKVKSGNFSDIKDSDLIIVTAGKNRLPGQTRLNLAQDNILIAKSISDEIKKYYNKGIILVVSNPVDVITKCMADWLDLPEGKIFGSGCHLDTSRFTSLLAEYFNISAERIDAMVIGEHGESQVQLWSKVKIDNLPLEDYCKDHNIEFSDEDKNLISKRVTGLGAEIIQGKGKTHYGIATCVGHIASAILGTEKINACVTVPLNGEYGINDVAMSVPCSIGAKGIENKTTPTLKGEELEKLQSSAETLKSFLN